MDTLVQDLRYALRGLLRAPGFSLAVVVTLALGIGANTTMFGVLDTLLLKPPAGVTDASGLKRVYFRRDFMGRQGTGSATSFPAFESLRASRLFSSVAAMSGGNVSVGFGATAQQARVAAVSASLFPMLGVRAERGRFFDAADDQLGAGPVAVVSHSYWMNHLAGDPGVLKRTLQLGQFVYTIVGVAPPGFAGADLDEPDLWLPIRQATPLLSSAEALSSRHWFWLNVVARVAPGASDAAATAEANVVFRRAASAEKDGDTAATVLLGPIQAARGPEMSSDAKVAVWVGIVALAVLLVACANVANLLLARGLRRRTEMAVRAGLGAGRGRLVRQFLVESLVLALAGGAAGLVVALWGGAVVRAYLLPSSIAGASLLDARVLAFTAAVAVIAGLLAGSAPAWQSSRSDLAAALRAGGRDLSQTRGVLRSTLLTIQVALTLVLLVGAALFVRSLRHAETLDYGLDLQHLLVAQADLHGGAGGTIRISRTDSPGGPSDPQSALYLRLMEKIRANPAVASADVATGTPYRAFMAISLRASGRDSLPRVEGGGPYVMAVSPGFFATVGTRILRGRGFTDADVQGAEPVAVVGQTFARMVWPEHDAIGQCLYVGGNDTTCTRVVGVAADARSRSVTEERTLMYYLSFAQRAGQLPITGLLIRTREPARLARGEVQRALQGAEPGLPYVRVDPLLDIVTPQWRSWQLGATMLSAFGLLALVIASVGLYGVTAYGVTQRTQEIGVRIALGALSRDVIRLTVAQAVRVTVLGAAIGLGLALALGRAVASLLFGVTPLDAVSLLGGVAVLVGVAAAASYVPARRAAQVDPMEALRSE